MYMITKRDFMTGIRYESPVAEVFTVRTEGVLCASTQMFDEETDVASLFGW